MTWTLVHQGGHHDVWCDGEKHRKCFGGYCHAENDGPIADRRAEFNCDCKYWQSFKAAIA